LAAGFDKDAKLYKELSNFGFGFIEIGTLTQKDKKETLKAIVSIKKIRQLLTEWVLIMVECSKR
jgi:dihydroorotate dehydrogenase